MMKKFVKSRGRLGPRSFVEQMYRRKSFENKALSIPDELRPADPDGSFPEKKKTSAHEGAARESAQRTPTNA
jgi:hypothetical protein